MALYIYKKLMNNFRRSTYASHVVCLIKIGFDIYIKKSVHVAFHTNETNFFNEVPGSHFRFEGIKHGDINPNHPSSFGIAIRHG